MSDFDGYDAEADEHDALMAREPHCEVCGYVAPEGEGLADGVCSRCGEPEERVYPVAAAEWRNPYGDGGKACPAGKCFCGDCPSTADADAEAEEEREREESLRDFLRNPGPPPKHFKEDQIVRAVRGIQAARQARGMK